MGVERRRAGFRLPWGPDGQDSDDASAAAAGGADEAVSATTPTSEAAPGTNRAAAERAMSTELPTGAAASTTAQPADSGEAESDEFLQSLVGAMRKVAETSRDTSLAELRTAIETRIEALGTEASQAETDIRRQADTDLEGIGEWERTEVERVKSEAETKRSTRRTRLEEELATHRAASERAVEATRSRLAQHENELAAVFSQLSEISDPSAFVAAAKRMPRAPELAGVATPAAATEPPATTSTPPAQAEDPRVAALGITPSPAADTETEPAAEQEQAAAAEPAAESSIEPVAPATNPAPSEDQALAQRLAQLDERLSSTSEPAPASTDLTPAPATMAAASPSGEGSTAIVVKGLGSFGAITSFKQSLERVEGVRGVTLSLGPTGEFVYRASHAADFDIQAAIQSIEGPNAGIEVTDGTLVVTISRGR
jgi:hypothetical protein